MKVQLNDSLCAIESKETRMRSNERTKSPGGGENTDHVIHDGSENKKPLNSGRAHQRSKEQVPATKTEMAPEKDQLKSITKDRQVAKTKEEKTECARYKHVPRIGSEAGSTKDKRGDWQ